MTIRLAVGGVDTRDMTLRATHSTRCDTCRCIVNLANVRVVRDNGANLVCPSCFTAAAKRETAPSVEPTAAAPERFTFVV